MMRLIQMVLLLTGLLMVAAPGACTRKDDRGKPEAEKRTRTIGGWLTAAAVICAALALIFIIMYRRYEAE